MANRYRVCTHQAPAVVPGAPSLWPHQVFSWQICCRAIADDDVVTRWSTAGIGYQKAVPPREPCGQAPACPHLLPQCSQRLWGPWAAAGRRAAIASATLEAGGADPSIIAAEGTRPWACLLQCSLNSFNASDGRSRLINCLPTGGNPSSTRKVDTGGHGCTPVSRSV